MTFIVTYDVDKNHTEFKKKLFEKQFYNCVPLNNVGNKQLPNTTVAHPGDKHSEVEAEFLNALSHTPNTKLEKVVYVHVKDYWLYSNKICS